MDFQLYNFNETNNLDYMYNSINMVIAGGLGVFLAYLITDYMSYSEKTNLAKIKELETQLETERERYNKLLVEYTDVSEDREELEKKIDKDTDEYNTLVDEYNGLLDNYKSLREENSQNIKDYNDLVDKNTKDIEDYNKLVTKSNNSLDEIEALEKRIEVLESHLRRNVDYKIR